MSEEKHLPRKLQVGCIQEIGYNDEGEQGEGGDICEEGVFIGYGVAVLGVAEGVVVHVLLCGFLRAGFFGVLDSDFSVGDIICALPQSQRNIASHGMW